MTFLKSLRTLKRDFGQSTLEYFILLSIFSLATLGALKGFVSHEGPLAAIENASYEVYEAVNDELNDADNAKPIDIAGATLLYCLGGILGGGEWRDVCPHIDYGGF